MLSDGKDEDELLRFNDLDYTIDPVTSVCVSREFATYKATKSSYTAKVYEPPPLNYVLRDDEYKEAPNNSTRIEVKLTSGSRFIDPRNSYVKFKYTITAPQGAPTPDIPELAPIITFDLTSPSQFGYLEPDESGLSTTRLLTNFFDRVEWEHSCKRLITDVPHANHHVFQEVHTRNDDWRRSIASLFTLQSEVIQLKPDDETPDQYEGVAIIPLDVLLPSWNCTPGRLLSNRLVGGSTLRFRLAQLKDALCMVIRTEQVATIPPTPPVLTQPPTNLEIGFNSIALQIDDFQVVLDQRELVSSIDNLLWNQSVVYGSPSSYSHFEIVMKHEPVTWTVTPPEEGVNKDLTGTIGAGVDNRLLALSRRNLSRLDSVMTTILLQPLGTYFDFFLDFFKHPRYNEPRAFTNTGVTVHNDRHRIGYEYWPQKGLIEDQENLDKMLIQLYLFSIIYPKAALSVEEFEVYFGSAVLTTRRDEALTTSGKSFTQKRPLEVTLDYGLYLPYSDLGDQNVKLYIRTWMKYQRLLNVYGNILEWRE